LFFVCKDIDLTYESSLIVKIIEIEVKVFQIGYAIPIKHEEAMKMLDDVSKEKLIPHKIEFKKDDKLSKLVQEFEIKMIKPNV